MTSEQIRKVKEDWKNNCRDIGDPNDPFRMSIEQRDGLIDELVEYLLVEKNYSLEAFNHLLAEAHDLLSHPEYQQYQKEAVVQNRRKAIKAVE